MTGYEVHIMQSEVCGKGIKYAADVGVVRYMMVTSAWSSMAMNPHALVDSHLGRSGMKSDHDFGV